MLSARAIMVGGLVAIVAVVANAAEPQVSRAAADANKCVWLGELPLVEAKVGWSVFGKPGLIGKSFPIEFHRVSGLHSLGTPADARITYALEKRFRSFRASVCFADAGREGIHQPVRFQVLADGKSIWVSKVIRDDSAFQPCLLDVTGVSQLTLEAKIADPQATSGSSEPFAAWLEPSLSPSPIDSALVPLFDPDKFLENDLYYEYSRKLTALLGDENFAELEAMAKEARASHGHLLRHTKLSLFYASLQIPDVVTERSVLQVLEKAARWQKKFPESVTPRLVAAGAWEQLAIGLHGTPFGKNVTQEGWRLFTDRMVKGGAFLDDEDLPGADASESNLCLLWLGLAQELHRDKLDKYVEKAVQTDPEYSPIFRAMAYGLLPRWRGRPGDAAKFAAQIRDRIGGSQGQFAYFFVAENYCLVEQVRPMDVGFSRDDLEAATMPAVKMCAGDEWIAQPACWMACLNHDMETARILFQRIPPGGGLPGVWGEAENAEIWRRWADPARVEGEEIRTLWQTQPKISGLALGPGGKEVFVSRKFDLSCVNVETGKLVRTMEVRGPIGTWAVDPKGQRFLVSSGLQQNTPGALRLYTLGVEKPDTLTGHSRRVIDVAFNSAGTRAASGGADRQTLLWKLDDLDNPTEIETQSGVTSVVFSPNNKMLAFATTGGGVYLRDGETGVPLDKPLLEEGNGVTPAAIHFTPDGRKLILVLRGGAIQSCDIETREIVNALKAKEDGVTCSVVSRTGDFLAIGRGSGDIDLFSIRSSCILHTFHGHWGAVAGLDFLPSDESLVSGAHDGTIKLWDVKLFSGRK